MVALTHSRTAPLALSREDVAFYEEHGFLRVQGVFSKEEVSELSDELDYVIERFATRGKGWSGPWRQQLMNAQEESQSVLVALHEIAPAKAMLARALTLVDGRIEEAR